ncbi:MAG: hypothetical protein IKZ23_03000, partial [Clostridia bacterium]|nr:hypothetical protein [Clostridia bacterium]
FVCGSQPRENCATVYDGKKLFVIEFTTEELFDPADILVAADKGVLCVPVGKEVGEEIYKTITSDGWVQGTTDCHYDYKFYWDETRYYYYDSVCGTFSYLYQKQHWYYKTVSEEQRNIINRCLNYEDVKPPVEAIPPSEELYGGHLYIYTSYATYYDIEKHDQSGTHNKAVSQIMLNADWQEGEKSSEEYHYYIEFGHCRTATVNYNEILGLLWDEENNRYAYIDRATNLRLSAMMRAPDTAVSGVEKTEQFTVAPFTISKQSIGENYFIGINEKGEHLQIVWDQSQELFEGYVVNVTYDTPFVLDGTIYFYFNDSHGYDVENGISAYDVTIVKKPETAPLDKNREIDFTVSQYETYLKGFYGEQFGKNGYAIVITNLADLTRFETAYPSTADRGGTRVNFREKLTDRYFEEKTLIMLYATNQYLFTDYKVNKVTVNNGVLTADYTVNSYPGFKPTMVPDTLIVLEVKKADISDCTDFKFNGTINAPEKPKVEAPDTVDYEFHYNYGYSYNGAPNDGTAFSVTSYDVLKNLLENKYRLVNSDYQDKSPVESKLYELDEDFFKEKALICVDVRVNTSTSCEDLMSLKIHNGALMAKRSDKLTDEGTRPVLCYFIVDKDLVYAFDRCNVSYG